MIKKKINVIKKKEKAVAYSRLRMTNNALCGVGINSGWQKQTHTQIIAKKARRDFFLENAKVG